MKNLIFLLILLLSFNCEKSRSDENPVPVGSWKLSQTFISDGGGSPPTWKNVSNGYTITLENDYTFSTSQFSDCTNGSFNISNNIITFNYSCGNTTIPNKFKIVSNANNELILSNVNCDEQCQDKYVKQ